MPFIIVDLQGKGTAGGYLKIDGERAIMLTDDLLIYVPAGNHYLEFSSQSAAERGIANFNVAVGNYKTAAWSERNAVDGKISEYFSEHSAMMFTVISDASGHILDLPKYSIEELTDEKYQELTEIYQAAWKKPRKQKSRDLKLNCFCAFSLAVSAHTGFIAMNTAWASCI